MFFTATVTPGYTLHNTAVQNCVQQTLHPICWLELSLFPDWLITRRHCCRKWQTALDIIRSMVYDLVDRMNKDENCLNVLDPSGKHLGFIDIINRFLTDDVNWVLLGFLVSCS